MGSQNLERQVRQEVKESLNTLEETTDQLENTMINLLGYFDPHGKASAADQAMNESELKTVQDALHEAIEICLYKEKLSRRARGETDFVVEIIVDIGRSADCEKCRNELPKSN
jgi:hypothetical protein